MVASTGWVLPVTELAVTDGFVAGGADGQWLELGAAGVLEDDWLGSGVDVFGRPIL
jgi:hypothetical protein